MSKTYNCATLPNLLRFEQQSKWDMVGALAELIDNSFGVGRGNASYVRVTYDPRTRTLSVLDNGRGMNRIGDLFQGGKTAGDYAGDIGKWGAGGWKAVLWIPSTVDIWTLRDGRVMYDSVTWEEWFSASSNNDLNISDEWKRATVSNTPTELLDVRHGTLIKMHILPGRNFQQRTIIRELAKMFSFGLRARKRIEWVTAHRSEDETQFLTDPFVPPSSQAKKKEFDLIIDYNNLRLPVNGVVYYDEATTHPDSEIQIGYKYRVIRATKDCFRSKDGEESYPGVGVSGWFLLGDEWKTFLTGTKEAISDEFLYKELMAHVFEAIKPLLKMSEDDALTLCLDGLSIDFGKAIRSKGGAFEQQLVATHGEDPGRIKRPWNRQDPPGPPPEQPIRPNSGGDDGANDAEQPQTSPLRIIPKSDAVMTGHLCRADVSANNLTVTINADHPVVREMTKAKQPNKMGLTLLTMCEVANCVAENEACQKIINSWLPLNVASVINNMEEGRDRARTFARILVDRVRNPIPVDDEEAA